MRVIRLYYWADKIGSPLKSDQAYFNDRPLGHFCVVQLLTAPTLAECQAAVSHDSVGFKLTVKQAPHALAFHRGQPIKSQLLRTMVINQLQYSKYDDTRSVFDAILQDQSTRIQITFGVDAKPETFPKTIDILTGDG